MSTDVWGEWVLCSDVIFVAKINFLISHELLFHAHNTHFSDPSPSSLHPWSEFCIFQALCILIIIIND